MRKLAEILLVLLLCLALVAGAVSCGGGKADLTSEEMNWLGLSEADVEELRDSMTAEEWDEFVGEAREEYRLYKEAQSAVPSTEEPLPPPEKGLQPIEMLPDKFPGFCLAPAPNKIVMRPEIEGMTAGASGDYLPTRGGGWEDTISYLHLFIIEFPSENMATLQFETLVDEVRAKREWSGLAETRYKEVECLSQTTAVIATGYECKFWDAEKVMNVEGVEWPEFDFLNVHGRYLVQASIGHSASEPCGKENRPWPVPTHLQEAFFAALSAIGW